MSYLRNAWYPAAWSEELGDEPLARTFLDEPVVLYRDSAGEPAALKDMCAHRFAPLSLGKIQGDCIQCPYHGLVYDRRGACVHNPNGKGATPTSLSVASYPLHVNDGMIWIWMGDPKTAVGTEPPSYPFLAEAGNCLRGYLHVAANYQLVTDNLLDLSHAQFLHPFIGGVDDGYQGLEFRAEQVDGRVSAYHHMPGYKITPLFRPFVDKSIEEMDGRAHLHWEAPANMMLDVGATVKNADGEDDVAFPQVHLLTPESEDFTHYFWGFCRDREVDNTDLDESLREGISYAFQYEDEPMVRAVAQRMGDRSLFEMSPALLPQDEAAVRARRYLSRLIASETELGRSAVR